MEVMSELVVRNGSRYLVALMPSSSNPDKVYRTDVTNGRCDCPAWKFRKANPDGSRSPCKHLIALGYVGTPAAKTPALVYVPKEPPKLNQSPQTYEEML